MKQQKEEQSQIIHGLLEFINKNRKSENSKISKLYKILQETKVVVDNTREKWETKQ